MDELRPAFAPGVFLVQSFAMRLAHIFIAFAATLALSTTACDTKSKESGNKGSEGTTSKGSGSKASGSKASGSKASGSKASGGTDRQVKPKGDAVAPTVEDLAKYTADLDGDGKLQAKIETSMGDLNCELFEKEAPLTVANFVGLARGMHPWRDPKSGEVQTRPFYDGLIFHRVIPGFMIQGGDPLGKGTGGPGYRFANEISGKLRHDAGTMSMANSGPNTNGSQFFVMEEPQPRLDGKYNVFGKCKETDIVAKITGVEKAPNNKERPAQDVVIQRVIIHRGNPG